MKKILAMTLFLAMMLTLIPGVFASSVPSVVLVDRATVFNVNSGSVNAYNPSNAGSGTYHEITAPYDRIAVSTPAGYGSGPHYRVTFYLNQLLDVNQDRLFINEQAVSTYGVQSTSGVYENGTVSVIFTPKKGGNTEQFTLKVMDGSAGTTSTYTVSVRFIDQYDSGSTSSISGKPIRDMTVRVSGQGQYYTAQVSGNTLYIDYNSLYLFTGSYLNASFSFADQNGYTIDQGYVYRVTSYGKMPLVYSFNYDRTGTPARGQISGGSVSMPITLDTTNTSFTVEVETPYSLYRSKTYNIVWRDTGKASTSNMASIAPTRYPTLTVGESMRFYVTALNSYVTGNNFHLEVGGTSGIVTTNTGETLTIRAQRPGTTWLNVRSDKGYLVDTIYVTVLDGFAAGQTGTTGTPSTGTGIGTYQVNARSLNVRSGAGIGSASLGKLKRGDTVQVHSMVNGWANITWGAGKAYVSASYLTLISSAPQNTGDPAWSANPPKDNSGLLGGGSGDIYYGYETSGSGLLGGGQGSVMVPPSGVSYVVAVDSMAIYSNPGTQFTQLGTVYKGDVVAVSEINAYGWAKISSWGRDIGYVAASGLKLP